MHCAVLPQPVLSRSDILEAVLREIQMQVGQVQLQRPGGFAQTIAEANGPVKVSLHDCLACSGCVTSAETVLLQHQSIEEFAAQLSNPEAVVVISLSPQSVVSLAGLYGMQPGECAGRLATILKSQGARAVFDIAWARDVALTETAMEFVHRYRSSQRNAMDTTDQGSRAGLLPMLASACPGWVCYAEKTHGQFVLPYIASSKSPQAVMGTVIKRKWAVESGVQPSRIYHCSVMPCYDKKLEAARDDFVVPGANVPETDCVLATTELHEWLQNLHIDIRAVPPTLFDAPFSNQVPDGGGSGYGLPGSSGGYIEAVARTAARQILGLELPSGPLPLVQGRNPDIRECTIHCENHRPLRFAAAYGFRNIQGLMRKIKLNKCEYDYVEVMACPSGCLNGGGQLKPAPGETPQQVIERLEAAYHHGAYLQQREPHKNSSILGFYSSYVGGEPGSSAATSLLHTEYHLREKAVSAAIADW
jgi:iron only hydrogenase large subunit-like protein